MLRRAVMVIAAFAACFWLGEAAAEPKAAGVIAIINPDGAIELEGVRYTDAAALKAKIGEINRRTPEPAFHVRSSPAIRFEIVGKAIKKLQNAGAHLVVGFITEPAPPR